MNDTHKEQAEVIAAQLGGRRFLVMTGANIYHDVDQAGHVNLLVQLKRYHAVRITLMDSDTYSVEYFRMKRDYTLETLRTASDVYAEDLQNVFTNMTGLETSLGTMGRA